MRWIFIYGEMRTGGTETLILRLAGHLAEQGREVALLATGGENLPLLNPKVELLLYDDRRSAEAQGSAWLDRYAEPATILSFDPITASIALSVELASRNASAVHLNWILHPRAFFMDGERADRCWLNRRLAAAIGYERLVFMNMESRSAVEERWKVDLSSCPIVPIPVTERPRRWTGARGRSFRIVSVGRMTDFKQYNLGASAITKRLIEQGLDVSWDLFGNGEMLDVVEDEIAANGMHDHVTLRGTLPYAELPSKLLDYDLFVGLGTAALEAAMLGVPTIAVTDSSRDGSYGWFHQLPFGNLGERQEDKEPTTTIPTLIRDYLAMEQWQREALSQALHASAVRYSLPTVARKLEDVAGSALQKTRSGKYRGATASLYKALTEGFLVRVVRQLYRR